MKKENLYTTEEAAEYCGMTNENFRYYPREGRIKEDKGSGRLLIFRQSTLDAFKAQPIAPVGKPRMPLEQIECTCDRKGEPDPLKHMTRCRRYQTTYQRNRRDGVQQPGGPPHDRSAPRKPRKKNEPPAAS
jgi:hypothetical protein